MRNCVVTDALCRPLSGVVVILIVDSRAERAEANFGNVYHFAEMLPKSGLEVAEMFASGDHP